MNVMDNKSHQLNQSAIETGFNRGYVDIIVIWNNFQMEMMSSTDTAFKLFDKDKDGFITRAEFAKVVTNIYI